MTWIQLLSEEPGLLSVVQRLAPRGTPVRLTSGRAGSLSVPPVAVVVATSGSRMDFVERSIRDVEARGLRARTVILAPFSRDLATGLLRLTSPHVVWLDEVTRDLKSVLHHMVESDLRFVICQALLRTCGSDPLLERAVRQAFTGSDCPTTVSELASRAHCTPSTLRAHWRRSDFPDSPQALVEWAVLAALAELREEGSKISAVSRIVGLHETTLYRAARRRIGVSPTGVGRSALLGAIDDWLPARAG